MKTTSLQSCYQYNDLRKRLHKKCGQIREDDLMADLGRAFIKSENARNVGKLGNFSDANRYEIELGL